MRQNKGLSSTNIFDVHMILMSNVIHKSFFAFSCIPFYRYCSKCTSGLPSEILSAFDFDTKCHMYGAMSD